MAQEFRVPTVDDSRKNKWDFSFNFVAQDSETSDGSNGSSLKLNSDVGWGFGIHYNMHKNFSLGFDYSYIKPRYTATYVKDDGEIGTISHEASFSTGLLKGTWYMLDNDLTPYADLGLGWTYADSNVSSGPPTTGCWWDPWWGYICAPYWSTYSDTSFSYGGGLGVRWNITPAFFLKGSYNLQKVDLSSLAGDPTLNAWKFELGGSF